ncbi:MAG: hypothetical protein JWQ04_3102, partial [Pedosphaera sp.]|nr:hypothetical protein [Pedosphaera sp.]
MQPISFTAASAEQAVAQIRAQLGPEAIVLNVRPLPAHGLARLWQKPMIEVLACIPEAPAPVAEPLGDVLAEFRQQLDELKQQVAGAGKAANRENIEHRVAELPLPRPVFSAGEEPAAAQLTNNALPVSAPSGSTPGNVLEKSGLLP